MRSSLLRAVLESSLGISADGSDGSKHFHDVRRLLGPSFNVLAKDQHGRIQFRSLRYAIHRHFASEYGIVVSSMTYQNPEANSTEPKTFAAETPMLVREALHGNDTDAGYTIDDISALVLMIEHLIADEVETHLHETLNHMMHKIEPPFTQEKASKFLQMLLFELMSGDTRTIELIREDPQIVGQIFEDMEDLADFVDGQVRAYALSRRNSPRRRNPRGSSTLAWSPMRPIFSVQDLKQIALNIVMTFGDYWEPECKRVKAMLVEMDTKSTGRVSMADFHRAALHGEWRFSESTEYLRKLGALDESSSWHGPRLIIPNYMQGVSNCIMNDQHYRVCCRNECEDQMDEIEAQVGAPQATPAVLLPIIEKMTVGLEDVHPRITSNARSQLQSIAAVHNGVVPLHGRLFAQFLHFLFPQECPFPHRKGAVLESTPWEFPQAMASKKEMLHNANAKHNVNDTHEAAEAGSHDWMTQWDHEEEMLAHRPLTAPWEANSLSSITILLVGFGIALIMVAPTARRSNGCRSSMLPVHAVFENHKHYV